MKRIYLFILCLFFLPGLYAQVRNLYTLPTEGLQSIWMFDDSSGWAAGEKYLFKVQGSKIIKWDSTQMYSMQSLFFTDRNYGYGISKSKLFTKKPSDFMDWWREEPTTPVKLYPLRCCYFTGPRSGWAGGDKVMMRIQNEKCSFIPLEKKFKVNSICMIDSSEGWAVGSPGNIILHYRSGKWSYEKTPECYELFDIDGKTRDHVWAVGWNKLLHYDGKKWKAVHLSINKSELHSVASFSRVQSLDAGECVISNRSGMLFLASENAFRNMYTFSWQIQDIQFNPSGEGWVCGSSFDVFLKKGYISHVSLKGSENENNLRVQHPVDFERDTLMRKVTFEHQPATQLIIRRKDSTRIMQYVNNEGFVLAEGPVFFDQLQQEQRTGLWHFYNTSGGYGTGLYDATGKQTDSSCQYNRAKRRVAVRYWKNGKQEGVERCWYDNGELMSEILYSNGVKSGQCRTFWQNGKVKKEWVEKNGIPAEFIREYDEQGKLTFVEKRKKDGTYERIKVNDHFRIIHGFALLLGPTVHWYVKGFGIGIISYTAELGGLCISMVGCGAKVFRGVSISPVNFSDEMNGVQIGIINYANNMNGLQLGLINYAVDDLRGVQVGGLNITGTLEVSSLFSNPTCCVPLPLFNCWYLGTPR